MSYRCDKCGKFIKEINIAETVIYYTLFTLDKIGYICKKCNFKKPATNVRQL